MKRYSLLLTSVFVAALLVVIAIASCQSARAQTNTITATGADGTVWQFNLGTNGFPTGLPVAVSGPNTNLNLQAVAAPISFLGSVLPGFDPTLTNTFNSGELTIGFAPLWKSQNAAGATPYLSTYADYYFARNFGAEAELVSLGDGTGSSTVDSGAVELLARKDVGNLAGKLMLGGAREFNAGRYGVDLGAGIEYRYRNHIGIGLDTRGRYMGFDRQVPGLKDTEWLTRANITFTL